MGPTKMTANGAPAPRTSRLLARILDHRRRLDYLWLAAFAAMPIGVAWWIGALNTTIDGFAGYGTRLNWTLMVIILPVATWILRWIAGRIGPISPFELPKKQPPVITLVKTDAGKQKAYAALRGALLSPRNLLAGLLITVVFHVVDMGQLAGAYVSQASEICAASQSSETSGDTSCANALPTQEGLQRVQISLSGFCCQVEKDWSIAYLSADPLAPGKLQNLALNIAAYTVQFMVAFIAIILIILILRHNVFFLTRVYQRSRVQPGDEASYIHIDLDDKEKCFGFRPANDAFNIQVLALGIGAVFILVTRFANVNQSSDGGVAGLFPDAGQWLAVVLWLAALTIVSLPILVKLLPRLPSDSEERAPSSLVGYLREFLSDETWAFGKDTPHAEIDGVAGRFAANAFWPTGNNRAWQLYFLSFWVFFIVLVPDPRAAFHSLPVWSMFISWAVAGAVAWVATWALFRILTAMLSFVDSRLVELPSGPTDEGIAGRRRQIPIGIFISYRRDDTAAYSGRLYDSLSSHIDKDRIFMDIDKIPSGADFTEALKSAIDSAQAMIVVIGPEWTTLSHKDGSPRIHDPEDFVYQEIAHALKRDIRIFPVLMGGANMPAEADLPDGLKTLAVRNALEISNTRWVHDVGLLIQELETLTIK